MQFSYNQFYLYLIRHGQTPINALKSPDEMEIGQAINTPLTQKGVEQAEALAARFAKEKVIPDIIFSSDYTRAMDTAEIVVNGQGEIEKTEALREYSAGLWTGKKRKDIYDANIETQMATMHNQFLPPDGESLNMVERRVSKWLDEDILYDKQIQKLAFNLNTVNEKPLNIFAFSHGMTIKSLIAYIMGNDKSFNWKIHIENTSITKFYFGKRGWELCCINDCGHIL